MDRSSNLADVHVVMIDVKNAANWKPSADSDKDKIILVLICAHPRRNCQQQRLDGTKAKCIHDRWEEVCERQAEKTEVLAKNKDW